MAVNRTKVLEAAQKFLSKGQYDKAIAEYQKLVNEDPRDVRTLLKIGDLHTRRNKPKDAIDVYHKVAELYAKQGFFLKAVAVYKQILKLDPTHVESSQKLAKMYEELALTSDALSTYEQVADGYMAQSQTVKALETMQRMIELDPQNVAVRIKYAETLSKADRPREAATAFAEGAQLLKEQGRMDDYLRVVERQLYHDPENINIARELSNLYLERSDPKRALAKLQICFKADPKDIQTLEMLAEAFRQLGQIPKTISVLKEIARLHSDLNAQEPRRRTLKRILDLDPNDAEAKQSLGALGAPLKTQPGVAAPAPTLSGTNPGTASVSSPGSAPKNTQARAGSAAQSDLPPIPESEDIDLEVEEASADDLLGLDESEDVLIVDEPQAPAPKAPAQPTRSTVAEPPRPAPAQSARSVGGDQPKPVPAQKATSVLGDAPRPAPAQSTRSAMAEAPKPAPDHPLRSSSGEPGRNVAAKGKPAPQPRPETTVDKLARLVEQADDAESAGRYEAAEEALKLVLALDANHMPSHERLKDLYLATDRRVDAVRELLWLSDAWTERNHERAVQFAKAAYDLAPNSAATKNRLRAMGVDPDREKQEEVMFVEDSRASTIAGRDDTGVGELDAILPPIGGRSALQKDEQSGQSNSTEHAAFQGLLDVPLHPDEFDGPPPVVRSRTMSPSMVSELLGRPITPEEFEREPAKKPEPQADRSARATVVADENQMAALLDAPISPDDFEGPPPKRRNGPGAHVDALLNRPHSPDDFGLADERFDRSGLIDMDEPPGQGASRAPSAISTVPPGRIARAQAVADGDDEHPSIEFAEIGTGEIDIDPGPTAEPTELAPRRTEPGASSATGDDSSFDSVGSAASFQELGTADLMTLRQQQAAAPKPPAIAPAPSPTPLAFKGPLNEPLPAKPTREFVAAAQVDRSRDETDFSDIDFDSPEATVPGEPIPELVRQTALGAPPFTPSTPASFGEERDTPFVNERPAPTPVAASAPKSAAANTSEPLPAASAKTALRADNDGDEELPPELEEAIDEADFFASQGLHDEALEVIQEAILIYPKSRTLMRKLAEYEASAEETAGEGAPKLSEPSNDDSFDIAEQLASDVGDASAGTGAPEEMIDVESVFAQFKKGVAAQISVDDSDTHFDLGIAYKEMGLLDDAMQEFETAARSAQRACTALTMIGMCCLEKGDVEKAAKHFESALASSIKSPAEELALLYEIGNVHELLGQLDRAIAVFEKVQARDRSFRGVVARLDQLKKRGGKSAGALG